MTKCIRYSPDAMSHSLASAREQPLEVVRVYTLLISSVHLLYFKHTLHCRVSARYEVMERSGMCSQVLNLPVMRGY